MRRAERHRAREIIDDLRNDARPVDRIDAGQSDIVAEARIAEQALEDRLRIVERAFERDGMDVGIGDRGHLPALHVRHAAMRIEDEDVDLIEPAEGLDRGGARIAGGGADHRRALAARLEGVVHETAQQLHRHVLEGERGAVEQLEQEEIVGELRERRDRRVAERAVGVSDHRREVFTRNSVADEGRDDGLGGFRISAAGKPRDGGGVKLRIGFRQVEPAVGRKPGQRRLGEIQRGRLAAGGNVTHVGIPEWIAAGFSMESGREGNRMTLPYRRPPASFAASGMARSRSMATTPSAGPIASAQKA